jgi:spoIIIJ-associated protein
MKKDKKTLTSLVETTNQLLSLMGTQARAEVVYDDANEAFRVDIDAKDETGLLIGRRGETINSLQAILGMIFKQQTGEWARVVVNVGDYREKQEEYLKNLAKTAAERAISTNEPQFLYNLSAQERRVIHMELAEDKEVVTESTGEEPERCLVIKLKK